MMTYEDSLELEHYGVKGMKWGVRRYQNVDGTYTLAGKERYKETREKLDNARANVKAARKSGSKENLIKAKNERNRAYRENLKARLTLNKAKSIDRGERIDKAGATMFGVKARGVVNAMDIEATRRVGQWIIDSKISNQKVRNLSTTALSAGSLWLQTVNAATTSNMTRDLYNYRHRSKIKKQS